MVKSGVLTVLLLLYLWTHAASCQAWRGRNHIRDTYYNVTQRNRRDHLAVQSKRHAIHKGVPLKEGLLVTNHRIPEFIGKLA
jgi:hypothetical protein